MVTEPMSKIAKDKIESSSAVADGILGNNVSIGNLSANKRGSQNDMPFRNAMPFTISISGAVALNSCFNSLTNTVSPPVNGV